MQLLAFKIQHFRSIVDTGWHQLAHDNITSLIGQNESGKTSVLEALKAFHDGQLIEDMLRSDLSLPNVSCRFRLSFSELENRIEKKRLNPELRVQFEKAETVTITRIWEDDMDSYLVMGEELEEVFRESADKMTLREQKVIKQLDSLTREIESSAANLKKAGEEVDWTQEKVESVRNRISELKRQLRKFPSKERKAALKKEQEQEEEMYEKLQDTLKQKKIIEEEKKDILDALKEKHHVSDRLEEIRLKVSDTHLNLATSMEHLKQILQMTGMYPSEKEQRAAEIKEEIYRTEIDKYKNHLDELKKDQRLYIIALEQVFEGKEVDRAIKIAKDELSSYKQYYSSNELAEEIFKILPDFEIFEDFSSLLPNRIDLEDIIRANRRAEGYKAALNFLTITGLEYSFFQQPSSRILKQKIETLNGELTLNFQEFWRQNVGKKNKISVNFELSHYDHTNPEKSGKPFIEFWIKDELERLYPKQRSRGVRWFLSFFLELKATAMDKSQQGKILLIDEPGVSLHARAQEDVLKVFDDIKDQIQIIYTTHSPHLVDENKLYRILAVQRAREDDMKSETRVYSARSLKSATADTLSPIYASMGAQLNQQEIIKATNNVIVKDLSTFYFMKAVIALTGLKKECHFLPASRAENIPTMVNILLGWGIEYLILNFDNKEEQASYKKMMAEQYDNKLDLAREQMLMMDAVPEAEDLLSTIDFKKYLVKVREGITVSNSEYLSENSYSRVLLSSDFLHEVNAGKIKLKDLDEESRENLNNFKISLSALLK